MRLLVLCCLFSGCSNNITIREENITRKEKLREGVSCVFEVRELLQCEQL